jgi:hypothetical protein
VCLCREIFQENSSQKIDTIEPLMIMIMIARNQLSFSSGNQILMFWTLLIRGTRDLHDKRLFIPPEERGHSALSSLIGSKLDIKLIQSYWDEILRLATSIKQGTVTASSMLRKLGSYPPDLAVFHSIRSCKPLLG